MALKRLTAVGLLAADQTTETFTEIPASLDRRARLVYEGVFESMDGTVTVTREHLERLAKRHNKTMSKFKRLASGEVPIQMNPKVQLDHSRSASATIGRLFGDLEIEDFEIEDGKTVKCLMSPIRILGRENVEKVLDGRWSELSIGADFDKGELEEVSVTPFPAAKKASLLSRLKSGEQVFEDSDGGRWKVEVILDQATGLYEAMMDGRSLGKFQSEDAAMQHAEEELQNKFKESVKLGGPAQVKFKNLESRLRNFFKLSKKMTDEETDKKMKKLEEDEDEEELKKLAEEIDEEEKKAKAEKLTAAKSSITRLAGDFRANADATRLAAKTAAISHRLSSLRSSGKVTPAEIKKINLTELAGKSEETVNALMKSYEDRQPVILVGTMGSMKALTHAQLDNIAKTKRLRAIEKERLENIPSFRAGVKLAEGEGEQEGSPDEVNIHVDTDPHTDLGEMEADYMAICSMMDEGKIAEVKERLKGWMGRLASTGSYATPEPTMHEQSGTQLAALQTQIAQLQANFEEAIGLAESLASGS